MSTTLLERGITRIAIIDDDPDNAELTAIQVRRLGVEPVRINGKFRHVDELVNNVFDRGANAAVCDNSLQQGALAEFYGAAPVAQWYDRKLPAVLYTQYLDQDCDLEIRQYLSRIPRVLTKEEVNHESIAICLNFCLDELEGNRSLERQACRTLVRVTRIPMRNGTPVMDVIVPSWNPKHAVRLPISLLPSDIQKQVTEGMRLFASVNTGAENPTDLFFNDFEIASEPLTEEEIDNLYHS